MSRSSYCEARDKLSWEAFAYLLDKSSLEQKENFKAPRWHGHRVRAVDGSCIQLPRSEDILNSFPVRGSGWGDSYYPYAYLVIAADIFTCQTTHSMVGNKHSSERDQLLALLGTFEKGDIAILDRGFDGKRVWKAFVDSEQHFLGRIRARGNPLKCFQQNLRDQIVEIQGEDNIPFKMRVVRGPKFTTGSYLFMATNLLDSKRYSRQALLDLYRKRQAVEDVFLNLKQTLNVKNIRSKKLNGILQEIYAALTMTSIIAGLRFLFEQKTKQRRISFKAIAWRLESAFIVLLTPTPRHQLTQLFSCLVNFTHQCQPGRSYRRYSNQPANKWIGEKRRKLVQSKKRGLHR